jgi:hypothetical protein
MSKQCKNPGTFKYTWPGRDESYICATCVEKLKAIAAAFGMYLQIRAVPEEEQSQCWQFVESEAKEILK